MNVKEYLEKDEFTSKDKRLIYPFPDNEKFVYGYIINKLIKENNIKVIELTSTDETLKPTDVFRRLSENRDIEVFSYYTEKYQDEPIKHFVKFIPTNDEFQIACELMNNPEKLFKELIK